MLPPQKELIAKQIATKIYSIKNITEEIMTIAPFVVAPSQ